jgi:glycosyltransferase involved in cell wall biosynthesis
MIEFNVVIATYNSAATLERCLESVRAISPAVLCNVVLIDGASTDNTLEIAEKYSDILNIVVSEPDCGIYDAWNKGLTYCTHRWVMFLGSDDYICPTEFLDYVTFIQRQRDADFVSSLCRCRRSYYSYGWSAMGLEIVQEIHVRPAPGQLHFYGLFRTSREFRQFAKDMW